MSEIDGCDSAGLRRGVAGRVAPTEDREGEDVARGLDVSVRLGGRDGPTTLGCESDLEGVNRLLGLGRDGGRRGAATFGAWEGVDLLSEELDREGALLGPETRSAERLGGGERRALGLDCEGGRAGALLTDGLCGGAGRAVGRLDRDTLELLRPGEADIAR